MKEITLLKEKKEKVAQMRNKLLKIAEKEGSPLYIFDKEEVILSIKKLKNTYKENDVDINIFYAVKSNYYKGILKTLVEQGEGLDVSSPRELKLALEAGAKKIIYTGPAKQVSDFEFILKHNDKIFVNLESERELKCLGELAQKKKKYIKCALRIITKNQTGWTKFGLPLAKLKSFFNLTKKYKYISFCGIHFHISHNKNPDKYIGTFKELGKYIKENFTSEEMKKLEYIDMGGGLYIDPFEAAYPWNKSKVVTSIKESVLEKIIKDGYRPRYLPIDTVKMEEYIKGIADSFKKHIRPLLPNLRLCAEPGRFICQNSMHLLLRIIDIKNNYSAITDGGNNIIGWEKYQCCNYVPIFNLTHFNANTEKPMILYGSLCTPDDIWGYYLYGNKAQEGDIIVMPFQGAYTYTLAQEFIRDIPKVYEI